MEGRSRDRLLCFQCNTPDHYDSSFCYVSYWKFEGLCKCFALKIVSFVGPVNIWRPRGPTFAVGMISMGIQKQQYCPEINDEALHMVRGGGGGGEQTETNTEHR